MTRSEYKTFKSAVAMADAEHTIWWAGYYWINLSEKQGKDITEVLEAKPFIKADKAVNGKDILVLPSGLGIYR